MPDFAKLKVVPIYSVAMYLELELKARWAVAREMPICRHVVGHSHASGAEILVLCAGPPIRRGRHTAHG